MKLILVLCATALLAKDKPPAPADPVSDHLRFEIARARGDLLLVKPQYDEAAKRLQDSITKAEAACDQAGMTFDALQYGCKVKPPAKAAPEFHPPAGAPGPRPK